MALPMLLGGIAKGIAGGAAKGAAKKFVTGKKKNKAGPAEKQVKSVADKATEKSNKAKVKPKKTKVSTVNIPTSVYKKDSDSASQTKDSNVSFESLGKQLESINKTTKTLTEVGKAETKVKKEEGRAEKKRKKNAKAKAKEEKLEKKKNKGGGLLGLVGKAGSKFNIFSFLTNVGLGMLTVTLLDNIDAVMNVVDTLIDNFANPLKFLKSIIVGVTTVFAGPITRAFNVLWNGLGANKNIVTSLKKKKTLFRRMFEGIGKGLLNFTKSVVKKVVGIAKGGAAGAAKGAVKPLTQQKGAAANVASNAAAKQATNATKATTKFGAAGGKRMLKFLNVFKRVPVIGGVLSVIIDLLLGEPLDRAVVGAIGGGIGAWIGGGIGSLVFPFAGTAAGAILGSMIGDWAGKALYEMMKKKIGMLGIEEAPTAGPTGPSGLRRGTRVGQTLPDPNNPGQNLVWTGVQWVPLSQAQQYGIPPSLIQQPPNSPLFPQSPLGNTPPGIQSPITGIQLPGATNMSNPGGNQSQRGQQSGTPTQQQAFNQIYNIAKKVGGAKYPEIVAAQAMHETGYLANPNSVFFNTNKTNAFGQTISANEVGTNGIVDKYWYRNRWWAVYDSLESSVKHHIKLWHDVKNNSGNYNAFNTPLEGIASVAPAYSPDADPANIALGYTVDKYSKGMVRALNVGGFDPKGNAGQQSSQPTPTMQPTSPAVPLGRSNPFAPASSQNSQSQAQVAQQQNQTVTTQGTINDMYKGATNTSTFQTTSGYGMRKHPIHGDMRMHTGVDIAPPGPGYFVGLKVPGKVTRVGTDPGGYGKFVIITSQETGYSYMFAHMATIDVKMGEQYTGQPIGEMGTTGGSTGIHLHYEVYKGGKDGPAINPEPFMNLLTMGKVDGQTRQQTAQVSPNQQTPNQGARVSSRPSYDPYTNTENAGGGVVPVVGGGGQPQTSDGGGGGSIGGMGGPSTQDVLNSYYKSQLLGFLYKQG